MLIFIYYCVSRAFLKVTVEQYYYITITINTRHTAFADTTKVKEPLRAHVVKTTTQSIPLPLGWIIMI